MVVNPVSLSTVLSSTDSPHDLLARLRQLPLGSRARFTQPDTTTLVVASGSKLRYRLLGSWSSGHHLPMKLRFALTPLRAGTSVHLTLTSDEGWYLVQTRLGRRAYQARFAELLTLLKTSGAVSV